MNVLTTNASRISGRAVIWSLVASAVTAGLALLVTMADGPVVVSSFLVILTFCPWVVAVSVRNGRRGVLSRRLRSMMLLFGIGLLLGMLVLGFNFVDNAFSAPVMVVLAMTLVGVAYMVYHGYRQVRDWRPLRVRVAILLLIVVIMGVMGVTNTYGLRLSVPVWFATGMLGAFLVAYTLGQWYVEYRVARQLRAERNTNAARAASTRRPETRGASGTSRRRRRLRGSDQSGESTESC